MRHIPIKLGPLALLLAVISICMTTLGILTFTTAGADLVMAEKYAATVRNRYELEYQGQSFLRTVGDMLAEGTNAGDISGTETDLEDHCTGRFQACDWDFAGSGDRIQGGKLEAAQGVER